MKHHKCFRNCARNPRRLAKAQGVSHENKTMNESRSAVPYGVGEKRSTGLTQRRDPSAIDPE